MISNGQCSNLPALHHRIGLIQWPSFKVKVIRTLYKKYNIYNIYRGVDIDMWCESIPSSPIRIVCPCTDATWENDVCHRYLKFKSVWPCSMCIHYNTLVSKTHRADLRYIHACMGFKHQDLSFKYLNSTLHWLWPHLFFYTHTVVFSL